MAELYYQKIHTNLVFSAVYLVFVRTPGAPIRIILVYTVMLPCLAPSWPQIVQIRISFRSHSDLVLGADHASDLYPISFCRRLSHFVVFQTRVRTSVFALFA